ncbi:hypothetical protein [Clostridium sp. C2-6-12]|uniref:hypothetical protein n=1 Tax=Clostridium sp. C2-6-12 TaxID=2698832 RepID=UPI00136F9669|nr:hypothetical protein [Clostridium sp. C2-6-12]
MDIKAVLDYKKSQIINLMLEKGVQPEELTENIWNDLYKTINIGRVEDSIICSLTFVENNSEIKMNYIYNSDKILIRIEEILDLKTTILWDRKLKLQELINDLCEFLRINYSENKVQKVLNTFPEEIKKIIQSKEKIA